MQIKLKDAPLYKLLQRKNAPAGCCFYKTKSAIYRIYRHSSIIVGCDICINKKLFTSEIINKIEKTIPKWAKNVIDKIENSERISIQPSS